MVSNEIVRRYARALVDAAEEQDALDALRVDARELLRLIESSEEFRILLTSPALGARATCVAFERAFGDKVHPVTRGFLRLLAENRRECLLEELLRDALRRLDEREGGGTARVTSATELTPEQRTRLAERLSSYVGKSVRLEISVDPTIKAGFTARIGDLIFDGSLSAQLKRLRALLAGDLR